MPIDALIEKHSDKSDLDITRVMGAFAVVSAGQIAEADRANALMMGHMSEIRESLLDETRYATHRDLMAPDRLSISQHDPPPPVHARFRPAHFQCVPPLP